MYKLYYVKLRDGTLIKYSERVFYLYIVHFVGNKNAYFKVKVMTSFGRR